MVQPSRLILITATLLVAACSSNPDPGRPRRVNTSVITEAELMQHGSVTVRNVIDRIRPQYLRTRGPTSINDPTADRVVVYVGITRMGGVEVLDQFMASEIREIRYLSAADATQRFGLGHSGGVILLTPRGG